MEYAPIEIEWRTCPCGRGFKCSVKSKQKYHSNHCERDHRKGLVVDQLSWRETTNRYFMSKEKQEFVTTGVRSAGSHKSAMSNRKRAKPHARHGTGNTWQQTPITGNARGSTPRENTLENKSRESYQPVVASSGPVKIENDNVKHKGDGMTGTNTQPGNKSTKAVEKGIQLMASTGLASITGMGESQEKSLLDDSAQHLFTLMQKLSSSSQTSVSPEIVNAACNCGKNIREIIKLKLDAIKLHVELSKIPTVGGPK